MSYFITGATGFIGRHLVERLLAREGTIYALVRAGSLAKLERRIADWGAASGRVVPIVGDLSAPGLGVSEEDRARLRGAVQHFFHLAAIYELGDGVDADAQYQASVNGTRHALALAADIEAGRFHHVSSIAAAGLYPGVFREDMFDEAEGLDHPYFRAKHDAEGLVRKLCKSPWRVYRPAIVVGHSRTGVIDKIDGPYYLFKLIQRLRDALPQWMPTIGIEGARINLVPVDFVAAAIDHIGHKDGEDGGCFHLTDPRPRRVGEVLNIFAKAAHAPRMTMRINTRMFEFIPPMVRHGLATLAPIRRITNQVLRDLGIPREILRFISYPTRFDSREAERALAGTSIAVPDLESYAWRLWDYWERHLDPDLFVDRSLSGKVKGRVCVVTGASSGIGKSVALRLADAGAEVVLVARGVDKLRETLDEIIASGGVAHAYPCDLTDMGSCDALIDRVSRERGPIAVLVNNAGRSIRRSIVYSYDRFHDFERTMQLNYFGSLRLILRSLPRMVEAGGGHIINISSIGVLTSAPRFSAYVASKAALDAFSKCAASEFKDNNIHFSTINMPLVRTPMIAPTKLYRSVPTISPEEAADMVVEAIVHRPQRVATRLGVFSQVAQAVAPKSWQVLMNTAFRLFPDSKAARGIKSGEPDEVTPEQVAFAALTRGIHW